MATQTALKIEEQALAALSASDSEELQHWLNEAVRSYQATSSPRLSSQQVEVLRTEAKAAAQHCLLIDPRCMDAMNVLARITLDQQQFKVADKWVKRALALDKNYATSWYSLGQIKLAQDDLQAAEKAFSKCIKLDSSIFRAHSSYAYTKLLQGELVVAFQYYRRLAKANPNDDHVRSKLFECLKQLKADFDNPSLMADIIGYLDWQDVNYNDLAAITASLLKHHYRINCDDSVVDIATLAKDSLLLKAMEKMIFHDAEWETFITQIRQYLLLNELQTPCIDNIPLLCVISQQSHNNEYVLAEAPQEREVIQLLEQSIQASNSKTLISKPLQLLLYSMYRPISEVLSIDTIKALITASDSVWPKDFRSFLPALVKKHCLEQRTEIQRFGSISNPISRAVKGQYELNPYPRWLALDYHTPTNYSEAIENALVGFKAPTILKKSPLSILIAGCGTGRHALNVARYFRDVEVLAVDISLKSLSYAKTMALHYELDNIEFLQADILELNQLNREFEVIECSGVLHHMEAPIEGARSLKQLLVPNGLMKIGLYSERARYPVVKCRELIANHGYKTDIDGIRTLRQKLINSDSENWKDIKVSPDFYSASGCRDLLFHVQEHRFNPAQLQDLCDTLEMKFLGFSGLNNTTKDNYKKHFPLDRNMTDLKNWDRHEAEFPKTFSAMYQFYLQS